MTIMLLDFIDKWCNYTSEIKEMTNFLMLKFDFSKK